MNHGSGGDPYGTKIKTLGSAIIIAAIIIAAAILVRPFIAPKPSPASTPSVAPAPSAIERIKKRGYLIVGTCADYPPFEYVAENGTYMGFDIDLAKAIAEELGVKLKIEDMKFEALLPALLEGKIDLAIAAITITTERMEKVDFSLPYYESMRAILVRKGVVVKSIDDLKGKKIGVQSGTTEEQWVMEELVKKGIVKEKDVFHYDTFVEIINALRVGHIDVAILDAPVAEKYAEQYAGELEVAMLLRTYKFMAVALNKNDKDLLELVNKVIMKLYESGEMEKLYKKWGLG